MTGSCKPEWRQLPQRQTRAKSRLVDAAPLMAGLNDSGRGSHSLPPDPVNIAYLDAVRHDNLYRFQQQQASQQGQTQAGQQAQSQQQGLTQVQHQGSTDNDSDKENQPPPRSQDRSLPSPSPDNGNWSEETQYPCSIPTTPDYLPSEGHETGPTPSSPSQPPRHTSGGNESDSAGSDETQYPHSTDTSVSDSSSWRDGDSGSVPASEAETEIAEDRRPSRKRSQSEEGSDSESPLQKKARVSEGPNDFASRLSSPDVKREAHDLPRANLTQPIDFTQPVYPHNGFSGGAFGGFRGSVEEANDDDDDADTAMDDVTVASYNTLTSEAEAAHDNLRELRGKSPTRTSAGVFSKG